MAYNLIRIDELSRGDHSFLSADDKCHFVMTYHPRLGFGYSDENDLFQNLKKPMTRKGKDEWKWKIWAIHKIADTLRGILSEEDLRGITIVPIPPSKTKSDPLYDDRLIQILNRFCHGYGADIREILFLKENYTPSHESADGQRLRPEDFEELYGVDSTLCRPAPEKIILFDDMITAGAHYVGCRNLLQRRFPDARIIGVFIFRRVPAL